MTDHTELIRRLEIIGPGIGPEAVTAIKDLVADYKGQGEALIREVNAKLEAQLRAEKAEADLAAARAALREVTEIPWQSWEDEHAPAIAAARAAMEARHE